MFSASNKSKYDRIKKTAFKRLIMGFKNTHYERRFLNNLLKFFAKFKIINYLSLLSSYFY
jgi:hypothetical protein